MSLDNAIHSIRKEFYSIDEKVSELLEPLFEGAPQLKNNLTPLVESIKLLAAASLLIIAAHTSPVITATATLASTLYFLKLTTIPDQLFTLFQRCLPTEFNTQDTLLIAGVGLGLVFAPAAIFPTFVGVFSGRYISTLCQ